MAFLQSHPRHRRQSFDIYATWRRNASSRWNARLETVAGVANNAVFDTDFGGVVAPTVGHGLNEWNKTPQDQR
jgi:hypothetical protein